MANFEIPENPKYTEEIRKFDITDSAHAELFNGVIQALINNETFLKKIQEKHADDTEEQFQQQYEQLTGYTDTKIGQLINGAPETLDTIKEVADAILENETIIEALNEAIGKKLNKDGDISDATVAFTSEDTDESPTLWKDIGRIVSGKLKEILNRVSIMSNNLKYLRKLCGTTDVSKIADGTLTGIVNSLNTDIQTLGDRYTAFNIGANSGRKLTFSSGFSAIVSANGYQSDAIGTFFVQGYGTGSARIHVATIQSSESVTCTILENEEAIFIRNKTQVPTWVYIFMLGGNLPAISI